MSEQNRIPQHVAIIMDGNGRWAELRGKERYEGHVAGVEPVRASLRAAARWGVKYLTLYAFSTENWGRPAQEVDALMELFCKSVVNETPELIRQGVEIRMIGDRTRFSEKVQRYLAEAEQRTAGGKTLTLILALNYSSRSEITRAVRQIAARAASGELAPEEISEGTISAALDTAPYPNPDLIVRTSGEHRLSNFLLWQASYAELYFPEVLWPDFTEEEFDRAMEEYARRDRRFGLVRYSRQPLPSCCAARIYSPKSRILLTPRLRPSPHSRKTHPYCGRTARRNSITSATSTFTACSTSTPTFSSLRPG